MQNTPYPINKQKYTNSINFLRLRQDETSKILKDTLFSDNFVRKIAQSESPVYGQELIFEADTFIVRNS